MSSTYKVGFDSRLQQPLDLPALLPTHLSAGGKITANQNVIGNCGDLQKKWRNEAKHSCQESRKLVSLEQSSVCLDALHGQ